MGDRICVQFRDGDEKSPMLYCHWVGLRALKAAHDALPESRMEVSNVMCNLVVKVMEGECKDASFYLYNEGECSTMADYDNWSWTFDIRKKTWTTTDPSFNGIEMTVEEVDNYVRSVRPCLYRECPCDLHDTDENCQKRFWDNHYKAHPEVRQ